MSRSGTSASMRVLQSAGLHVGDELIPANEDNEVGFYEDVEFMELDQELIAAGLAAHPDVRPRWMYADLIDHALLEPFRERAEALVAARAERGVPWGFKDPRAAALLDFWDSVAPDARYVFVYRAPWDVADSTFRLTRRPMAGRGDLVVRTWAFYNRALLDFAERHPGRCVLVSSAAVERAPEKLVESAPVELDPPQPGAIESGLLATHPETSSLAELLRAGFPEAAELYSELERRADLPSSTVVGAPANGAPAVESDLVVVAAADSRDADVVAVGFGDSAGEEVLATAAGLVQARAGRAVAVGSGAVDPEHPQILHARELLRGTFEPRTLVLRRSTWQEVDELEEWVAAAGLGAWAAAVALADAGVPLMPLVAQFQSPNGSVLPGARERARRHVAARHADLFARNYADVREQFDLQLEDLERQRDVALAARDEARVQFEEALAKLDEVDAVKAAAERGALAAEQRSEAADRRAAEAEERAAAAERRAEAAEQHGEERAATAEARAAEAERALGDLRQTRALRAANTWWRAKQRVRRR
jgi:hypothetical protein